MSKIDLKKCVPNKPKKSDILKLLGFNHVDGGKTIKTNYADRPTLFGNFLARKIVLLLFFFVA